MVKMCKRNANTKKTMETRDAWVLLPEVVRGMRVIAWLPLSRGTTSTNCAVSVRRASRHRERPRIGENGARTFRVVVAKQRVRVRSNFGMLESTVKVLFHNQRTARAEAASARLCTQQHAIEERHTGKNTRWSTCSLSSKMRE